VRGDPDAIMVVTPADQVVEPAQEFRRAVHVAEQMVRDHPQALVTFGIKPAFAATGYGYLERGPEIAQRQGISVYRVSAFREKPKLEVAEQYVASGKHFWNAGIFVWRAATILAMLRTHQPSIAVAVERIAAAWDTPLRGEVLTKEYAGLTKISIDFAVMEKATRALVVQAPYQWDDVGSWLALERRNAQDAQGNTVQALHVGINTSGCVIVGDPGRLIATIGVSNLLVIQDGDATLIADRRDEGAVKEIVARLKASGLEKYL
jgi:mannose-1-phosphate guanylyltransferase